MLASVSPGGRGTQRTTATEDQRMRPERTEVPHPGPAASAHPQVSGPTRHRRTRKMRTKICARTKISPPNWTLLLWASRSGEPVLARPTGCDERVGSRGRRCEAALGDAGSHRTSSGVYYKACHRCSTCRTSSGSSSAPAGGRRGAATTRATRARRAARNLGRGSSGRVRT